MNKYIQQSEKNKMIYKDGHLYENGNYHNPASCSVCIAKQANSIPPHKELCPNCGGDIAIRNPTGHCDHLYYPENVPHKKHKNWENEFDRYFLDINAFVATDHSPFPCSSKVFDGKIAVKCFISQLLLSTQQEAVEKERKRSIRRVIRMIEDFYEDDSVERALLISRIEKLAKDTI